MNSLIYLGFNLQIKPLDDLKVRLAIAHAIDKQQLVQLVLGNTAEPAFSPLAPTLPGFDPTLQSLEPAFDLKQSEALFVESGFIRNEDGKWVDPQSGEVFTLELLTSTRAPNEDLAAVLQDQLKQAGITVSIRPLESAAVIDAATKVEYQMLLSRYDWNDADILSVYLSTGRIGSTNRSFYSNPELDQILADAAVEMDTGRRNELYSHAQKILIAEQPWIPLYTPKDFIFLRANIQDVVFGPMGRVVLTDAWIKE